MRVAVKRQLDAFAEGKGKLKKSSYKS